MDTLTALEHMSLFNLPSLKLSFCDGACLPPNLDSFRVGSVRITEWGVQGVTTLSTMMIGGDDIINMFFKGRQLPISLVSLYIANLSETKSLEGNGLRHLASLKYLYIGRFSEIDSLSEKIVSFSLESLYIFQCPKLKSIPEDNLPDSLKILEINDCPLLEERHGHIEAKGMKNCNPVQNPGNSVETLPHSHTRRLIKVAVIQH
ncbi:LRR and NB-ARC domain disease resistance protein [Trifolium pratense]|uniref:LRR and NB-ARC domain disease resistance protein n=1 Tax=Trifolium pratense TaxID=57577 RepID=A0A2K3LN59_TRIPR|nr:LRR and NB-ARC domain disease resistance protein [Trifolium pratense]